MALTFDDRPRAAPEFAAFDRLTDPLQTPWRPTIGLRQIAEAMTRNQHLLVLRFATFNMAGIALFALAWSMGWIGTVVAGDDTMITVGIALVFAVGLMFAGRLAWRISAENNAAIGHRRERSEWIDSYLREVSAKDAGSRAIAGSALRLRLANRIGSVKQIANSLVLLGLIGTVIGFIIALSGVSAETAADPQSIAPMVGDLIRGMSVALYTTLAGAVFNLWLMVNFHILAGGSARLASQLIEAAEREAGSRVAPYRAAGAR